MAYQPSPSSLTPTSQQQQSKNHFEFTRRKKWTDIIISELPDTLILILDLDARIQYVNASVRELLGWDVEELSESSVLTLINDDDRTRFQERFELTASKLEPFTSYTRFKCKPTSTNSLASSSPSISGPVGNPELPQGGDSQMINQDQGRSQTQKELLFEVRGNLLFGSETLEKYAQLRGSDNNEDPRFFCFMAKPYPSRNMAILNTFLELKLENERLTQRRDLLKFEQQQRDIRVRGTIQSLNSPSIYNSNYTSPISEISRTNVNRSDQSPTTNSSSSSAQIQNYPYSSLSERGQGLSSPINHAFEGSLSASGLGARVGGKDEEELDEGGKRKKIKKGHNSGPNQPQYVCTICGRTDSPEWRKGPKGPKTLCNACGLRWAKRSKKDNEEPLGGSGAAGGVNNPLANSEGESSPNPSSSAMKSSSNHRAPMVHSALSVTPILPPEPSVNSYSSSSGAPSGQAHNIGFSSKIQTQTQGYQGQSISQGQDQGAYNNHIQSQQQQQNQQSSHSHPHLYIRTQHLNTQQQHLMPSPSPTHLTHATTANIDNINYAMDHVHVHGYNSNDGRNTGGYMHGQGLSFGPDTRSQGTYTQAQAQEHTMRHTPLPPMPISAPMQVPDGYTPIHPHSHSHTQITHPSLEQEQMQQQHQQQLQEQKDQVGQGQQGHLGQQQHVSVPYDVYKSFDPTAWTQVHGNNGQNQSQRYGDTQY